MTMTPDPRVDLVIGGLVDPTRRIPPERVASDGRAAHPGLYAWWVDEAGAGDLSRGLGVPIGSGLLYAGQAGAGSSGATLGSRLLGNHIRGNIGSSTLRLTLSLVLAQRLSLVQTSGKIGGLGEAALSRWMEHHLRLTLEPVADRATLGALERSVLERLDPPLNLRGMTPTSVRDVVRAVRRTR